jgi:PPOX class probable F420-dependent enzyme
VTNDDDLVRLLGDRGRGVLATIRRDGRPQLSTIDFCYDATRRLLRASTIEPSAKVTNLRRDPRASLYVGSDGMGSYAVAEGNAQLSAVAAHRDDETVRELVDVYLRVQGEHPDWDDYRAAMVRDRRLVVSISVERLYGLIR